MRTRLRHLSETLSSSYWFVPGLMMAGSVALALVMLHIDRGAVSSAAMPGWLYSGGADGAKTLLSTIAGSVVTVAGVVFSITIAALSQASSQFGPRLLRNFMRDTANQVVLGTFIATFLYCLLVLRAVHGEVGDAAAFVPHASVTVAVLLAAASTAVLIFFIHHVSISLQAPAVIAAVRADVDRILAGLDADDGGTAEPIVRADEDAAAGRTPPPPDLDLPGAWRAVPARCDGYVQAIDYDGLVAAAEEMDLVLSLELRPGDPVIAGNPLMRAWPAARCEGPEADARLAAAFLCGSHATPEQDVEHALRQLVEVAVRALSPGINDPFTAINCIDALGSALCRIARRGLPGPLRHDRAGRLRLLAPVVTFEGAVDLAFNQVRQYGRTSVAVTVRLLETIAACAAQVRTPAHRAALLRHAEMIHRQAEQAIAEPLDLADVRRRWEAAAQALAAA